MNMRGSILHTGNDTAYVRYFLRAASSRYCAMTKITFRIDWSMLHLTMRSYSLYALYTAFGLGFRRCSKHWDDWSLPYFLSVLTALTLSIPLSARVLGAGVSLRLCCRIIYKTGAAESTMLRFSLLLDNSYYTAASPSFRKGNRHLDISYNN